MHASSGASKDVSNQPSFLHNCDVVFPYSGMFRCTAVQTQSTMVSKHVDRIENEPRTTGSAFHV
jgi:hypothetical protein